MTTTLLHAEIAGLKTQLNFLSQSILDKQTIINQQKKIIDLHTQTTQQTNETQHNLNHPRLVDPNSKFKNRFNSKGFKWFHGSKHTGTIFINFLTKTDTLILDDDTTSRHGQINIQQSQNTITLSGTDTTTSFTFPFHLGFNESIKQTGPGKTIKKYIFIE
jgi:hypothetical protein